MLQYILVHSPVRLIPKFKPDVQSDPAKEEINCQYSRTTIAYPIRVMKNLSLSTWYVLG